MKTKQEIQEIRDRAVNAILLITIIGLLCLSVLAVVLNLELKEQKEKTLLQAESNCLTYICKHSAKTCATIQGVTYVQASCKSTVRGTDFYIQQYLDDYLGTIN